MNNARVNINSESIGNPEQFAALADLERALSAARHRTDADSRVVLIVRRIENGTRETLEHVRVTPEDGIPGDAWGRRQKKNPETQIAVMQSDVATLIANGQPLTLFGDQLFLALDLSTANLPTGSRVRVGTAILEVTPVPHTGCRKFLARFGKDSLGFVSRPELRDRNLRGIYMRVVESGDIRQGDAITILSRPTPPPPQ